MVKVVMTGGLDLVSVKIDKQVVDPNDVEMLEDLIMPHSRMRRKRSTRYRRAPWGPSPAA